MEAGTHVSEGKHDPQEAPVAGVGNRLGDGDGGELYVQDAEDFVLDVAKILERFADNTGNRFKAESKTPQLYRWVFRKFAQSADLKDLTRRQLAGPKGRVALLRYMETVRLPSKRVHLSALECVWTEGIGLPWPINRKRDFGKTLPPVGSRETPPDVDVKPWGEAVQHETDPYLRLFVYLVLQFGWRPVNQIGRLRWKCVRYGSDGKPSAIVAKGAELGFKTHSDIVALVPTDVADALEAWKRESTDISGDALIVPWRGTTGKVNASRSLDKDLVMRLVQKFERKWNLKHLSPVYLRHWVKTTLRKLSDPAIAAYQGHKPPADGSMRNVYDTPGIERILDEQRSEYPDGPLGELRTPQVTVEPGLEREMKALLDWKAGRLKMSELMDRLDEFQKEARWTAAATR